MAMCIHSEHVPSLWAHSKIEQSTLNLTQESAGFQEIEICDGSMASYDTGIDDETMENFDVYGWTYEYHFWNDECANYTDTDTVEYNISDNLGDDFNYTDACDSRIQNTVHFILSSKRAMRSARRRPPRARC